VKTQGNSKLISIDYFSTSVKTKILQVYFEHFLDLVFLMFLCGPIYISDYPSSFLFENLALLLLALLVNTVAWTDQTMGGSWAGRNLTERDIV
jgi:hypothetical protein